jgi:hypothetical protein
MTEEGGSSTLTTTSNELDTSITNYMSNGFKPKDSELLVASTIVKEVRKATSKHTPTTTPNVM